MLRVREKLASGVLPGTICAGSTSAVEPDSHDVVSEVSAGSSAAGLVVHDLEGSVHVSNGALVRSALAGGSFHDLEGFLPENNGALVLRSFDASTEGDVPVHATAGDSEEIIGLLERSVSQSSCLNSDNSSMGVACVDPASAAVASLAPVLSSPCSCVAAGAVHARYTASPMHDAHAQNSWSDTGSCQGPRGKKRSKGGVSSPAEDLRPVSEVEAGVNFRPAGWVRGQVAGSLPRRQPGTGTRRVREGVVTPSLHPEVPGIQFVSPGRGLDIRQSMGWTKVVVVVVRTCSLYDVSLHVIQQYAPNSGGRSPGSQAEHLHDFHDLRHDATISSTPREQQLRDIAVFCTLNHWASVVAHNRRVNDHVQARIPRLWERGCLLQSSN